MNKENTTEELSFSLLTEEHIIKPFDCEDEDLNDFLFKEAIPYQKQMLVTTFLLFSLPPAPIPPIIPTAPTVPSTPTASTTCPCGSHPIFPTTLAFALC